MKKSILIGLLFACSFVFGQRATVSGKILDKNTLTPIEAVMVMLKGSSFGAYSDAQGQYQINANITETTSYKVVFSLYGYKTIEKEIKLSPSANVVLDIQLEADAVLTEEVVVASKTENKHPLKFKAKEAKAKPSAPPAPLRNQQIASPRKPIGKKGGKIEKERKEQDKNESFADTDDISGEGYSYIVENEFKTVKDAPLSTFSIDVDRASYSNIRRFIENGQSVPTDAIRIEEMVNYFAYNYPTPKDNHPVFINSEYSACPWNKEHGLLRVALKAKEIERTQTPPSNLVFLIDVSGSMSDANKLPLLKEAFKLLVNNLGQSDKISMVVYAGAAGLVLPATSGADKNKIIDALEKLSAGGSTAGGAGIELAYKVAKENFLENGNNRVIIATDGDFNVGASSNSGLTRLVEEKRKTGIFLTCLGFGMGNYKDNTMETLADKGNGNYAYIDDMREAKKLFVEELTGTLVTVAKDVKIQVEFNPQKVSSYRLVGYENRLLNDEDFKDDTKDAGEIGAGHCVTALYEIIPPANNQKDNSIDLRYQEKIETAAASQSNEMALIKVRYKLPKEDKSTEIQQVIPFQQIRWADGSESYKSASEDFRFAAAVAMWGLLLRKSKFIKDGDTQTVLKWAEMSKGADKGGYRTEMIELVKKMGK